DMASAVLATKPFHGEESEDVSQWLRTVKMNIKIASLIPQETLQLIVLKLRDTAQLWAGEVLVKDPEINCYNLVNLLSERFGAKQNNLNILNKFLAKKSINTREEFILSIKEASILYERKFMMMELLVQLLIRQGSPNLKTLLYQISYENYDWCDIMKQFENCSWIVFEECLEEKLNQFSLQDNKNDIFQVDHQKDKKNSKYKKSNFKSSKEKERGNFFCAAHNWGYHTTENCEVIKNLQKNGFEVI
ncbi:hypothetical protein COBT_003507, partial [Conglomerata obtusa]